MRIGLGVDVHRLVKGRDLVLGGIGIPFEYGLLGHSDADVLVHAMIDALLGAIGAGDIGQHFPDTDPANQDAASTELLRQVMVMVKESGYKIQNIDITVTAQQPKLAQYFPQMQQRLAEVLEIEPSQINLKATTTEGMGYTGRGEGIMAQAAALLMKGETG